MAAIRAVPEGRRPQPVSRQQFTYDGVLTHKGIQKAQPEEFMRLVFEPKNASPAELAQWKVEHKKRVTNVWLDAQGAFYGLWDHSDTRAARLRRLQKLADLAPDKRIVLRPDAIHTSRCRISREELQDTIKLWETQYEAYSKVLDAHPKREAFDQATTMEEKLAVDADLFLDIYFLDRKTTPDPISLSAFDWDTVKTAVDKVDTLNVRVIGSGKKKVLRIGWNLQDVISASPASAQKLMEKAIQRELDKTGNRTARLEPHLEYLEKRHSKAECHKSIIGSYHMEIEGTGWNDSVYKPGRMWLDIHQSQLTEGVYEGSFDFGPALKGMMLISADRDALEVHSKIMDTMDMYGPEPTDNGITARDAWLDGYLCAMKRVPQTPEHEARFAAHKQPNWMARGRRREDTPTRYFILLRGSHRVPEWEEDRLNKYSDESGGMLVFHDGELCEFDLKGIMWRDFKGVPRLPAHREGSARGYKIADWPKHAAGEPEQERGGTWMERGLDNVRDMLRRDEEERVWDSDGGRDYGGGALKDLLPSRKRKRADWGSMREYAVQRAFRPYDRRDDWLGDRRLELWELEEEDDPDHLPSLLGWPRS